MNKSLITSLIMLLVGVAAGYGLFGAGNSQPPVAMPTAEKSPEPLFYRSPMNPQVTSPVPAKGPMGMDYIPVYADTDNTGTAPAGTVTIDPVVVQNIGVRTAIAKRQSLGRTVRAVGRVVYDESRMTRLHPKIAGWVEQVRVDKTGQPVADDEILLSIYSPKLVSTQQEYLLALANLAALQNSPFADIKTGATQLVESSRQRLTLLDVPEHQILELEQTGQIKKSLHIHSPAVGTVTRIGVRQGQYVTPQTELYTIVDLSQVWVFADIYENELPWVKPDDPVTMTLASIPGTSFTGKVDYIYPYAQANTRTTRVRMVFDNPDQRLRLDMFADIRIASERTEQAVVIPAEAVVRSGDREQVFVVRAAGKFEPRTVSLGVESGGQVVILSGVDAGEQVVTSAQFLLDSESKLSEATAKMLGAMQPDASPPMTMSEPMTAEQSLPADGGNNHD